MKKLRLILIIFVSIALALVSLKTFAMSESIWDMFDLNNIYYYDPNGDDCTPSSGSAFSGDNKLYNGREALSSEILARIKENQSFYQSAAEKYGFPWQIIAAIHFREHRSEERRVGKECR